MVGKFGHPGKGGYVMSIGFQFSFDVETMCSRETVKNAQTK
jgi:hypothetical protein